MATQQLPSTAVLILNLPAKTFVGIDLITFNSSPNFHGIINLPTGFHCLYTGTDATLSIRHCHWLNIDPKSSTRQAIVLRWNTLTESLDLLDASSDETRAAARGVPALKGRGLVDYGALQDANAEVSTKQSTGATTATKFSNPGNWPVLSRHIAAHVLDRILKATDEDVAAWTLSSISTAPMDMESIPGLSDEEAGRVLHDNHASSMNLLPINLKQTWPEGSIGRDRTDKARDRSWYLGHLLDALTPTVDEDGPATGKNRQAGAKELLAELQFCFLMVLTLANYSCLEQWKRILSVVLTCKEALGNVEGFFLEVVKVLQAQLERVEDVEGGLFEMNDEIGSGWLRSLMKTFRANVDEALDKQDSNDGLAAAVGELEKWLRETYGWEDDSLLLKRGMVDLEDGERVELQMDGLDEEEEAGEYAPVIVEM